MSAQKLPPASVVTYTVTIVNHSPNYGHREIGKSVAFYELSSARSIDTDDIRVATEFAVTWLIELASQGFTGAVQEIKRSVR